MEQRTKVFYGEVGYDGLVFVTAAQVDHIARLDQARFEPTTWSGHATALRELGFPEQAANVEFELEHGLIDDDNSFVAHQDAMVCDGDWGGRWLPQLHLEWVPDEVRDFGRSGFSGVSGEALFFAPRDEGRLVATFKRLGYGVECNLAVVYRASGRSYVPPEPQASPPRLFWDGAGDPVDFVERLLDVPAGTYNDLRGKTLEEVQASIAELVRERESKE